MKGSIRWFPSAWSNGACWRRYLPQNRLRFWKGQAVPALKFNRKTRTKTQNCKIMESHEYLHWAKYWKSKNWVNMTLKILLKCFKQEVKGNKTSALHRLGRRFNCFLDQDTMCKGREQREIKRKPMHCTRIKSFKWLRFQPLRGIALGMGLARWLHCSTLQWPETQLLKGSFSYIVELKGPYLEFSTAAGGQHSTSTFDVRERHRILRSLIGEDDWESVCIFHTQH